MIHKFANSILPAFTALTNTLYIVYGHLLYMQTCAQADL